MANYAKSVWRRGQVPNQPILLGHVPALTATTLALDSAGASGDGFGWTFVPMENGDLTDLWLNPTAYAGTWGSTDGVLNCEVRAGLVAVNRPGTTSLGSFTFPLSGSDQGRWVRKSGIAITLEVGKLYSLIVSDSDGGATNFVTLNVTIASSDVNFMGQAMTTANAWTAGSGAAAPPAALMRIAGKMYGGSPHAGGLVAFGNTTRRRGNKIRVDYPLALIGMSQSTNLIFQGTAGTWTAEIFDDTQAANATPLWSYTFPTSGSVTAPVPSVFPVPLDNQFLFVPGTTYRVVVRPAANSTAPSMLPSPTYDAGDEALIRSLFAPDGIDIQATEEIASNAWTDYPSRVATLGIALGIPESNSSPRPTVRY